MHFPILSISALRTVALAFFCLVSWACSAETPAPDQPTIKLKPTEAQSDTISKPKPLKPRVVMETTLGSFTIELFPDKAPLTVANFIEYVESKQYDGTIFHRIIPGFMAQGGGYDTNLRKKATRAPIVNESSNGLKNVRTTLSMARTMDPDSATAQFFINYVNNSNLDWAQGRPGYAVFGRVINGMNVVDAMAKQPQGRQGGPFVNAPNTPIVIERAYIQKDQQ